MANLYQHAVIEVAATLISKEDTQIKPRERSLTIYCWPFLHIS
jgi:hypothetical protein